MARGDTAVELHHSRRRVLLLGLVAAVTTAALVWIAVVDGVTVEPSRASLPIGLGVGLAGGAAAWGSLSPRGAALVAALAAASVWVMTAVDGGFVVVGLLLFGVGGAINTTLHLRDTLVLRIDRDGVTFRGRLRHPPVTVPRSAVVLAEHQRLHGNDVVVLYGDASTVPTEARHRTLADGVVAWLMVNAPKREVAAFVDRANAELARDGDGR